MGPHGRGGNSGGDADPTIGPGSGADDVTIGPDSGFGDVTIGPDSGLGHLAFGPSSDYGDATIVPGCPTRTQLELFAAGSTDVSYVSTHLPTCPVCREIVRELQVNNNLVAEFVAANRGQIGDSQTSVRKAPRGPLDAAESSPTEVVPGFRVEGEIHRGAQGVVYRAEQLSTRRKVALKTLLQGQLATSRQRARFDREVEVVASLRHPNIVTLFESGQTRDGLAFFAMELVDGAPLSDLLKSEARPSLDRMLRLYLGIAKAIAYAHQRGVIHRDLKPANILVDAELEPHVLDFGLARTARGDETQEAVESTAAGEFLGTFAYAAPEQLKGDPDLIDVRTDVFALGVILYEILAGERPWQLQGRVSIADLLFARLEQAPRPPSAVRPGIDADLDVIVLTCLKSAPEERYQTAAALAEDIERFLEGKTILARPDSTAYFLRKWVLRHKVATASGVVFTLVVIGSSVALAVLYGQAEANRARAQRTLTKFRETLRSSNPETGLGTLEMKVHDWLDLVERSVVDSAESDPLLSANILNTVEGIHLDFEDKTRPLDRLDRALEISRKYAASQGTTDAAEVAESLHNRGRYAYIHREFAEAEPLYREALAMWERLHGVDAPQNALTMRHLASTLRQRASTMPKGSERTALFDEATGLLQRTLAIYERQYGGEVTEDVAATNNALASLLEAADDYRGALEKYLVAKKMIEAQATEPDDYRIGRVTFSIAKMQRRLGRPDEAIVELRRAVNIMATKKGSGVAPVVEARCELADALLEQPGTPTEALAVAEAAAAGAPKAQVPELEIASWLLVGRARLRTDDRDGALTAFDAAMRAGSAKHADDVRRAIVAALETAGLNADIARYEKAAP